MPVAKFGKDLKKLVLVCNYHFGKISSQSVVVIVEDQE